MKKTLLALLCLVAAVPLWAQPFRTQEVLLSRADSHGRQIALSGTLTLPDARLRPPSGFPALVMVTGSGAQNRDEEILGHRPFHTLAQHLASQGVATLRFDDRGVGGSTGAFSDLVPSDLVDDLAQQWQWLCHVDEVDPARVGLLGHSEGGLLSLLFATSQDSVAFVALLASPGQPLRATLVEQNRTIFLQRGVADSLVERRLSCMGDFFAATDSLVALRHAHPEALRDSVKQFNLAFRPHMLRHSAGLTKEQRQSIGLTSTECYGWALTMSSPYMQAMLNLDPLALLADLRCPILALGGDRDCQVNAATQLPLMHAANPHCRTLCYPSTNHLFQLCTTGAVEEYATLGQSPHQQVLNDLATWILNPSAPLSR